VPRLSALALLAAAACLLTGVFLAASYAPTWAAAQPATLAIQKEVGLGWLLRGLHHWGGRLAIVFVALELVRQFVRGSYRQKQPWIDTAMLLLVVIAFGYTGYLLVGDERAYAGVLVLDGILRCTPFVGDGLADVIIGGSVASSATLARLYVVHAVILPALLVWLAAPRRAFIAPHAAAGCGVLAALALLAYALPPAVGEAGSPGLPPTADAQPEWFFLWVNELLHRVDGMTFLIGGLLPLGLVALLLALPWISRESTRKIELLCGGVIVAVLVSLSLMALTREIEAEEPETEEPIDPELGEKVTKTLRRFRCVSCHQIAGDEDGGEDGPPLPRGAEFEELYTRTFFRRKVGDPQAFWADTEMSYPKNRKPDADELKLLERYFYEE
jgi:quinol-cytochrome oxidoreductase complex cytochrome b subunit